MDDVETLAHAGVDPSEVRGIAGGGLYEGEEGDPHRGGGKTRGRALLGSRLLRVHGGRDETAVREYIQHQEEEDERVDQLSMWRNEPPLGGSR